MNLLRVALLSLTLSLFSLLISCNNEDMNQNFIMRNFSSRVSQLPYRPVIIHAAQSNGSRGLYGRLQNDIYNYIGIADGYPTTRVTQPKYIINPSRVEIYVKPYGGAPSSLTGWSPDNGSFQAYNAETNAEQEGISGQFGCELSLATRLSNAYPLDTISIIKCAWGGSALKAGITTQNSDWSPSGNLRTITKNYYISRAVASLKASDSRPFKFIVIWQQGESDALAGVTGSEYLNLFNVGPTALRNDINTLLNSLDSSYTPTWYNTELNYFANAAEDDINSSMNAAALIDNNLNTFDISLLPRKEQLTASMASPVNIDSHPILEDDQHGSYIRKLAAGEIIAENIIANPL